MRTFNLPDLGEGLQEAEIVSWHVNPGDRVVADQPLVSVETDKAVVEVPSPFSGQIAELFGGEGDLVKVGAPLVAFAEVAQADSGTVVGQIAAGEEVTEEVTTGERGGRTVTVRATPAVRALARRKGVDLALIAGSGADGMITAADVERAATTLSEAGPLEPLRGVRRAMASRMAHAHAEVVPATVSDDADVGAWRGNDVTVRLVRAIVAGCAREPSLNVWYDSQSQGRRLHRKIDLGIAVDTEDGLFVPVLRDVANRAAADLRQRPGADEGGHRGAHHSRPRRCAAPRSRSRISARSPAATRRRWWCRRRSRSSAPAGPRPGPWRSARRSWCGGSCRCRSPSTTGW